MKKHWRYVCNRFKEIPKLDMSPMEQGKRIVDKARENPAKGKGKGKKTKPQKIEAASMKELEGEIKELKKPSIMKRKFNEKDMQDPEGFNFIHDAMLTIEKFNSSPLPANYEIDDSDAPLAKNIFEFTTDPAFLNFPSYSKQLQFGTELFADICVRCSNPKWIEKGWPLKGVRFGEDADDPPNFDRIKRNITFFEYGVCKKCGLTRKKSFKRGYLNPYMEAAGVVGQRCVTGDTYIPTSSGIFKIEDLQEGHKEGFTKYNGPEIVLNNGAIVPASKFFYKRQEKVIKLKAVNGYEITTTPEHPLYTNNGWIKNKDIKIGTPIPIYYGQNVWGNSIVNTIRHINPEANRIAKATLADKALNIKFYAGKLTDNMFRLLGFWVSEGCGGKALVTNLDKSVIKDCRKAFVDLYGEEAIYQSFDCVGTHRERAKIHFNLLFSGGMENRSADKEIPALVLQSPKTKVIQFMKALFEGDGGFNKDSVEYCTISKKLSRQVSAILNNMGVIHRISEGETWATNGTEAQIKKPKYSIFIEGPLGLSQFRDCIGFLSKRKRDRLDATITKLSSRTNKVPFWYEKLPDAVKQEFMELLSELTEDVKRYRVWDSNTHRKYSMSYGITSFIDRNNKFWRIKADNVCLTTTKVKEIIGLMRCNPLWRIVSDDVKTKFYAFEEKYAQSGVYWTSIKSKENAGRQDVYDFHVPEFHSFMGNGFYNHNSGKSEISRQWLLYTLHRFLKLQKPGLVFGLGETSKLTFTVMAQTFAKAKRDLYDPLYATLTNSPWFKTYHEILTYYGEKTGIELFRVKDTFTAYRLSNIDLQPETPDTRNLRGATRAGAIMDELDWIDSSPDGAKPKSGGVRSNVEEIYTSVSRSFATIRTAYETRLARGKASVDINMLPPPMMICVSSPASTKSIMMKNLALSEVSRALYGFQAATWEVNPFMPRHCETIELEFKRNFDRAMRDYGAQPPHSSNPFIRDLDSMAAVISDYPNLIRTKPKYIEALNGDIMLSAKMKFTTPKDNINRIAAIDAGFSNNSFCIATGFYDEEEHEIICDSLVEIIPEPDKKINFNAVCANVLIPIIERMNVTYLVADRWQSKKLLADIEEACDIYTQEYSLKYKDMAAVRIDVYDGHFLLPKPEVKPSKIEDLAMDDYPFGFQGKPVAHLLYQFITVRDFEKEVVKGLGLTDDVFRAFCLLHKFIADPEYREFCSGVRMGETRQITPVLGVVGSRGQGPNGKPAGGGGGGNTGLITAQDGAPIGISVSRK